MTTCVQMRTRDEEKPKNQNPKFFFGRSTTLFSIGTRKPVCILIRNSEHTTRDVVRVLRSLSPPHQ